MKRVVYLLICLSIMACSKNDGNDKTPLSPDPDTKTDSDTPPDSDTIDTGVPNLIFPEKDQLCLDANITFNWSDATNSVSYQIQISTNRAFTGIVEDQIVDNSSLSLVMAVGQDYYWRVLSIDADNVKSAYSPDQAFYVKGEATSNYIPFNPSLTYPEQDSEVAHANVNLQWEGSDLDNDLLRYDIYLGTVQNPELFMSDLTTNTLEVSLEPNQTYHWQVHVSDGTSKSIGEIWSFRTN
ncbi:hypothetical protein SAMN05192540_2009 [Maribacter dokdonensis]|uniref:Fibronectin type-III domain-containing protein n=1 Tax=Maribacter dokdonensis TaxID=320912 RepID=A0A1H4NPW8_9FLAO|nr:hypothetical protein [Maribacter dokdonensis]SEB96662.1 hypothetical protein SAMN05192540_2009 [Maribacter dokdonensis]